MSALKQLTVAHLRGSIQPFSLPFEKGKKLTVVYGENGTGKSTLCDAFEFLSSGRVSSLDNRGLGQTARFWPSLGKTAADISVTLETSHSSCSAAMSRTGDVVVTPADNRPRAEIFRKSQILSLIEAKPGERYAAISKFIDVSGVEASEKTLSDLIRQLKDGQKVAIAVLAQNDETIRQFWANAGSPGKDPFKWAQEICEQGAGTAEAERAALIALRAAYARLVPIPENLRAAQQALKIAQEAARNVESQLEERLQNAADDAGEVVGILQAAQTYLTKEASPDVCPLCEGDDKVKDLAVRVKQRLEAFSLIQIAQASAIGAKNETTRAEQRLQLVRDNAREEVGKFEELLAAFAWPGDIRLPSRPIPTTAAGLTEWLRTSVLLPGEWADAESVRHERKQFVGTLRHSLETWRENTIAQSDVAALLPRLENALKIVMEERRRFTDEILAEISAEVARLYEAVHPGEGLNKINLELDPKKRASLEIGSSFCGTSTRPQAYFSDSHLDTLGLCIFLALSAMEAPAETILILDDVLASVDEPHVDRLIEMLYHEALHFRHCIITTHYRPWRDKFRWGWLKSGQCHFVELTRWTPETGMSLLRSVPDLERLKKSLNERPPDLQSICLKAGTVLEAALDFLTLHYECSLPRRSPGIYTLGELLLAVDKKLRQALRIDVLVSANGDVSPAYRTVDLKPCLEELTRIAQVRNLSGCHFNELSFELLDADALSFGRQVVELMDALTDGDAGWPRNGKSGEFWATEGQTRRLFPFKKPS